MPTSQIVLPEERKFSLQFRAVLISPEEEDNEPSMRDRVSEILRQSGVRLPTSPDDAGRWYFFLGRDLDAAPLSKEAPVFARGVDFFSSNLKGEKGLAEFVRVAQQIDATGPDKIQRLPEFSVNVGIKDLSRSGLQSLLINYLINEHHFSPAAMTPGVTGLSPEHAEFYVRKIGSSSIMELFCQNPLPQPSRLTIHPLDRFGEASPYAQIRCDTGSTDLAAQLKQARKVIRFVDDAIQVKTLDLDAEYGQPSWPQISGHGRPTNPVLSLRVEDYLRPESRVRPAASERRLDNLFSER